MRKTQKIVLGSLMLAALAFPSAFALAEKKDGRAYSETKARAEFKSDSRDDASRWGSFWSKFLEGRTRSAFAAENRAPVISGITAPTVLSAGQEGTWEVRASDPEDGSLSYAVDWGDSNMFSRAFKAEQEFVQTATFSHVYDHDGVYTVRFTVMDEEGRTAKSSVTVRVDGDEVQAPVISDLSVDVKSPYKAKIVWDTDIRSDSSVWVSTSSPVDMSDDPDVHRRGRVKHHVINLKHLEPDTMYYAVARSETRDGGVATSSEVTFTTPAVEPPENEDPVITSVAGPETIEVDAEGEWTVNALDPEDGPLSYSVDWGDSATLRSSIMMGEPFVQTSTFTHTYAEAGSYIITFTVQDDAGATAVATTSVEVKDVPPPPDDVPPVISDIIMLPADESIVVQWTTDEPSDSKAFFGTSTPVDVSETGAFIGSDALVTDHELVIEDLSPATLYYLRVQSVDESDNASLSDELSTTTESGA
ncbi:MAG: hypothetical protein AMXMBFR44_2980 [Candidatus Campbellbacteria bacterium]